MKEWEAMIECLCGGARTNKDKNSNADQVTKGQLMDSERDPSPTDV